MTLAGSVPGLTIRSELARTLLDLAGATRADRLRIGRDLLARAGELSGAVRRAAEASATGPALPARPTRGRKAAAAATVALAEPEAGAPSARVPAAERRAAALALIAIWRDVARDLARVGLGERAVVRQVDLLDDLEAAAARLPAAFAAAQLRRLDTAGERLEGNVSPELVVDALAIGWAA